MVHVFTLGFVNITFIPTSGVLDLIFHQTWFAFSVLGAPPGGYRVTLIQLLIILVLALAINGITERLTTRRAGGLVVATILTIIGAALAAAYIRFPFDFALEGVRILAALLGAVILAVFYNLITGRVSRRHSSS